MGNLWGNISWGGFQEKEQEEDVSTNEKKSHRRRTAIYKKTLKYEYRQAFSEMKLLDLMKEFRFKKGTSYNFITGGDINSLSFLKCILRTQDLDYCLASTWCMAAEDILQFKEWIEEGKIKKLDLYLGEIFASSYRVEYEMVKRLYSEYPNLGRFATFRNHSKIYAGTGQLFSFGIQSSANINTNPRTEQSCIVIDDGIYNFYKDYFDGIKSFNE